MRVSGTALGTTTVRCLPPFFRLSVIDVDFSVAKSEASDGKLQEVLRVLTSCSFGKTSFHGWEILKSMLDFSYCFGAVVLARCIFLTLLIVTFSFVHLRSFITSYLCSVASWRGRENPFFFRRILKKKQKTRRSHCWPGVTHKSFSYFSRAINRVFRLKSCRCLSAGPSAGRAALSPPLASKSKASTWRASSGSRCSSIRLRKM